MLTNGQLLLSKEEKAHLAEEILEMLSPHIDIPHNEFLSLSRGMRNQEPGISFVWGNVKAGVLIKGILFHPNSVLITEKTIGGKTDRSGWWNTKTKPYIKQEEDEQVQSVA